MSKRQYPSKSLTVTWDSQLCIHSEVCWRGLSSVFKPRERPWIHVDGADDSEIAAQIDQCPSGALGYELKDPDAAESAPSQPPETESEGVSITPTKDGPYEVLG